MKNIAIFASGQGSNALNLIEASRLRSDIVVSALIVDNPHSPLPKIIQERFPHVPVHVVLPDPNLLWKAQKVKLEMEMLEILENSGTEWIFLAGYMRIVGSTLLSHFKDRIINIHPSLLPEFPGLEGFKQAFDANVPFSGVTIHLVDEGMDTGAILLQESFPRHADDTLETFTKRGKEIEWRLYPAVFDRLDNLMQRNTFLLETTGHTNIQIYWLDSSRALSALEIETIKNKISDSVDQIVHVNQMPKTTAKTLTYFKGGVTDNSARSFQELVSGLPFLKNIRVEAHSGLFSAPQTYNPLILAQKNIEKFQDISNINFSVEINQKPEVKGYDFLKLTNSKLIELSKDNCWALSGEELNIIQSHYKSINRNPTDVEIEMLAQTWSEHCKHKIFAAEISYEDDQQKFTVNSLFKEFIKAPTYKMNKPWAISLFDDNAGVVRFREGMDLCIKVETHNSPSALDPYGGALTGILGVNRDILGTGLGAKPVANTDVFCVGMPGEKDLPKALLAPEVILKGIHHGVQDGGNKSGIPTVNGAIYFDESFSGKPLVYCGTVGIIPPEIKGIVATKKGQRPGDMIVMVGGDVGMDGIHGATASSLVMDKSTTIGMVQIGDPFSQKRMIDFILAARDELLFNSITDNGAGGLSSSVGEMSGATNGAILKLDSVPLKYPGLSPWQILVSESQERMTLSVEPQNWQALKNLANIYQVKVTNVGEFTNTGRFVCTFKDETVCDLSLAFLHDGLPKMKLKAKFDGQYTPWKMKVNKNVSLNNHEAILNELLSHPTISSKEKWVRQYDHEVQGGTVVKPIEGLTSSAPNNAGVLWYGAYGLDGYDGFAVASGLCPHFSIDDTYLMAQMAVDESVRNLLCHGVDPDKIALVDNFCWPDPTPSSKNPDAEFKLAQLVRTCMGLKDIMETYQMPLVSGKDSMKNDYHGDNVKISVLPTLLVTALGHVPDVREVPKSQAESGNLAYRIGLKDYSTYFGHFLHEISEIKRQNKRSFEWNTIRESYTTLFQATQNKLINSIHDVSEGGFLPGLVETLMMNNLGLKLNLKSGVDRTAFLYSELPGHFIVTVTKSNQSQFESHFSESLRELLGVTDDSGLVGIDETTLNVSSLAKTWRNV